MSKIAVIYWSGTGNTQQMAEAIANQAHADLFTASEFGADKAANYDAFAFGCSAMGAEQLEEDEFEPMWNAVAPVLGSKKVVLFGSYGWGGGEWMDIWKRDNAGLNIVDTVICQDAPDAVIPLFCWNWRSACSVSAPKLPSAPCRGRGNPAAISALCKPFTASPESPICISPIRPANIVSIP